MKTPDRDRTPDRDTVEVLRQAQWYDWRLPLGPDEDGIIALSDPVTWQRVEQADPREQGRGS